MAGHCDEISLPLLSTVRDVIDKLGGTMTAATRLGVSPPAVSLWLGNSCFPPARYLEIAAAVKECGCDVDHSLFRSTPRPKSEPHAA
jgi:DNA-binding transcriptional regulator YdaS (Cro superfamily)